MPNLYDYIIGICDKDELSDVTKSTFGVLVHSDDPEEVEKAMKALESAGGYENLPIE